jgi:threonine synthase
MNAGVKSAAAAAGYVPWRGVIAQYRDLLPPVPAGGPVITLGEGATPLLPAPVLSARTGCEVYLKVEGANPTGSFKDRGMTLAVSMAVGRGATAVICASTGNTSASAAAYAARAGLSCAVLVPRGKIALGKLAQALVHGAKLLQVDGNFDDCLELARKLATDYPVALVNSVNADRLEGQKTAAFEIVDALVTSSTPRPGGRPGFPGCSASRPAVRRPSSVASRCGPRRPSRPRSGSATRHPGGWLRRPGMNLGG